MTATVRLDVEVANGPLALLVAPPTAPYRGTVLMVPGFTGSKEDFRFVQPTLAAHGYRAVAVDQRGQYESPGPEDPEAYSVAALGSEVRELVAVLGDGPVHLVGHSFGGLVTRAAVLQGPGLFRSHVLMDSGPDRLVGPRRDVMQLLRPLVEQGGLPAVWEAMDATQASTARVSVDSREFRRTKLLAGSPAGLLAMGDALLSEPDRVDELTAVGLATLVLYGEGDDAWTPAAQAQMARRLGAATAVIPGAAHSPAAEQPECTAAALVSFLSAQP